VVQAGALLGSSTSDPGARARGTGRDRLAHRVAGLTLGGGIGWILRRYGLTVDSLLSVRLVTADGEVVRASEHENPDLFLGLARRGGNFGVRHGLRVPAAPAQAPR